MMNDSSIWPWIRGEIRLEAGDEIALMDLFIDVQTAAKEIARLARRLKQGKDGVSQPRLDHRATTANSNARRPGIPI